MKRLRFNLLVAGLFVLVFVSAVIYYLPASSVISELQTRGAIPNTIELTQVEGPWWNAQAELSWSSPTEGKSTHLGGLHWQWQPLALLSLNWSMHLQLNQKQGGVKAEVEQSLLDVERLSVLSISAQQNLSTWQQWIPEMALLGKVEGTVQVNELSFEWNYAQQWPEHTYGQVTINQLKLLGETAGSIQVAMQQSEQELGLQFTGGPSTWRLQGQISLTPKTYSTNIAVEATDNGGLPEWSETLLRRESDSKAIGQYEGNWK